MAGDACAVPLASRSADTVLAVHLLEHPPEEAGDAVAGRDAPTGPTPGRGRGAYEPVPNPAWGHVRRLDHTGLTALVASIPRCEQGIGPVPCALVVHGVPPHTDRAVRHRTDIEDHEPVADLPVDTKVKEFTARQWQLLINGDWAKAKSEQTFHTHNPATGELLAECAQADAAWRCRSCWRGSPPMGS